MTVEKGDVDAMNWLARLYQQETDDLDGAIKYYKMVI
jgi:hypothetical protein